LGRLALCLVASLAFACGATGQPLEPVFSLAKKERQPFLDTLKQLVSIETGTRDLEGLEKAAYLIAGRLQALGGKVEMVDPTGAYGAVRVTSRDRKIVYLTAFTNEVSRPSNLPRNQQVSFGESAPDRPVPISIWWSDDSVGRQFIYR